MADLAGRLSKVWRGAGMTSNLAELSNLDESIILKELIARYNQDTIYTYVGDILIAINPLKPLPIYDKKYALKYRKADLKTSEPHIYATASHVYQCMLGYRSIDGPSDQCIVISGESGAGKTESTKLIVKHIIELCNGNTQLEQQILQMNPLIEAFGNAKTVINDNSSRFGKYIQLQFVKGTVVGAKISEYLLEKSRVVHQNPGDGNFHIFNYMFYGCSDEQKNVLKLHKSNKYRYTKSVPQNHDEQYYVKRFEELLNAMDLVGFSELEQSDMFSILSAVLSIGNINFSGQDQYDKVNITYYEDLETAALLLGVECERLKECLTCLLNRTRGEIVKRDFNKQQAEDARDAVAKVIYGRLFSWIVNKINQRLAPEIKSTSLQEIGILDIFGFENFTVNSFEQACINLANEHLQYFFNEHIFSLEQEEYKSEGIKWSDISYHDNQQLLDLFLKRPIGILALLDEESHFPQSSDSSLIRKLNTNLSSSTSYVGTKSTAKPLFTIRHYAGDVTYNVTSWLEKNRDTTPPSLSPMLTQSHNELLRTIFKGNITRTGTLALQNRIRKTSQPTPTNTKKLTVGSQFKNSLQELIKHMSLSEPHFVRCLKPNKEQKPNLINQDYLLKQLKYTGMLQTVQIRRDGYPIRPYIDDFLQTYSILLMESEPTFNKETCVRVLNRVQLSNWHVGRTKVFLKEEHLQQLNTKLDLIHSKAIRVQSVIRGFIARVYYKKLLEVTRQQKKYVATFLQTCHSNNNTLYEQQCSQIQEDTLRKEAEKRMEEKTIISPEEDDQPTNQSSIKQLPVSTPETGQQTGLQPPKPTIRTSLIDTSSVQDQTYDGYPETLVGPSNQPSAYINDNSKSAIQPSRPAKPKRLSGIYINDGSAPPRRLSRSAQDPLPAVPDDQPMLGQTSADPPPEIPTPTRSSTDPLPEIPIHKTSTFISTPVTMRLRRRTQEHRSLAVANKISKFFGEEVADDDEIQEDDFSMKANTTPNYGKEGSKAASISWFKRTQIPKLLKPSSNDFYDWFHGFITRSRAESLLKKQPVGSFMLRLTDKRLGYVLSFRAEDRCRHYMVAPTPSNKFVVVGEPKVHKTLKDLADFHSQNMLSNWTGYLIYPCGQADPSNPDYGDILHHLDQRPVSQGTQPSNNSSVPANWTPEHQVRRPSSLKNENEYGAPPLPPKLHIRKNGFSTVR